MKTALLVIAVLLIHGTALANPESLAVLGDSISVGAVADSRIYWDVEKLEALFSLDLSPQLSHYSSDFQKTVPDTKTGKIGAPKIHWVTAAETGGGFTKAMELEAKRAFIGGYISTEEYSWPYLVGRAQGMAPKQIHIVASAGDTTNDTTLQMRRLIKNTKKTGLPDQIFILFAGLDLCRQSMLEDTEPKRKAWAEQLIAGIRELLQTAKPSPRGTHLYLIPMFDMGQIVDRQAIQEKKTYGFGQELSCREFLDYDPKKHPEAKPPQNPIFQTYLKFSGETNLPAASTVCPAVLTIKKGSPEHEGLRKHVAAHNGATSDVEANIAGLIAEKPGFAFTLLKTVTVGDSDPEDIANDCFHFSLKGQEKVARAVLKAIER